MANAHKFFVPLGVISLYAPPKDPALGDTYFDVALGGLRTWDGDSWTSATVGPTGPPGPIGGDPVAEIAVGPDAPTDSRIVLWVNTGQPQPGGLYGSPVPRW